MSEIKPGEVWADSRNNRWRVTWYDPDFDDGRWGGKVILVAVDTNTRRHTSPDSLRQHYRLVEGADEGQPT